MQQLCILLFVTLGKGNIVSWIGKYFIVNAIFYMQLEELKIIPEKSEKEVVDLGKQLEKLQADKLKQEEQLKEVMESFKTETGVRYTATKWNVLSVFLL